MRLYNNIATAIVTGWQAVVVEQQTPAWVFKNTTRQHRSWGSRDRKLFGKGLYDGLRWLRKYADACQINLPSDRSGFEKILFSWAVDQGLKLSPDQTLGEAEIEKIKTRLQQAEQSNVLAASIPDWLEKQGRTAYTTDWPKECAAFNQQAPLIIRANSLKTTPNKLKTTLWKEAQIETDVLADYPEALLVHSVNNIAQLKAFQNGLFEIQDGNSQKVGHWINPQKNQILIDACAGAGGKSLHLGCLMENTGQILALDQQPDKLERLQIRAERNGVNNIQTISQVTDDFYDQWAAKADTVLIDAPCSGLGVLRRHPEHKWTMNPKRITALCDIQKQLLEKNALLVKPEGQLVYVTCSIFPNENQQQISTFIASDFGRDFTLAQETVLLTHQTGHDGFYMAKMIRKS